jgi:hypothetical protein
VSAVPARAAGCGACGSEDGAARTTVTAVAEDLSGVTALAPCSAGTAAEYAAAGAPRAAATNHDATVAASAALAARDVGADGDEAVAPGAAVADQPRVTAIAAIRIRQRSVAAGAARVDALVPPVVRTAASVVPPVATVEPPPVGATAERAKIVGVNRFGLDCETTAGPGGAAAPVLPTNVVATGAAVPAAFELPPGFAVGRPLTAANKVFGVTSAARFGPVGIEACFVGADAIGACPVGVALPPAASTPTATAAVIIVLLVAIVIADSFPLRVPSNG